jgi:predicted RNase H-like HicB family nuclease
MFRLNSTALTKQNAKELIREAIESRLDGLREDRQPIPEPASVEVVPFS